MRDPTEEDQVRAIVRELYSTPTGRAVLDGLFSPVTRMTEDEIREAVEDHIRAQFPGAPVDPAEWDRWPA